ncbi:MAG: hypothetical protein OWU84_00625 [Firmicutes bacterium]|nr:hypothetical protein [Bacillota bacterium]
MASRVGHSGEPHASNAAGAAVDPVTPGHVMPTVDAMDEARRQRALAPWKGFVLITTVTGAAELLAEYKGQVHGERPYHFLKDSLFIDAIFVKKPERLEALGYVLLGTCLLDRLAERRWRRAGIPIPSPARRVLTWSTIHELRRLWQGVQSAAMSPRGPGSSPGRPLIIRPSRPFWRPSRCRPPSSPSRRSVRIRRHCPPKKLR